MKVFLRNFSGIDIDENFFNKILFLIQKSTKEKVKDVEDFLIGVILVGQNRIRNINKMYRGKNQVTSVLSFPLSEIKKPTKKDLQFIEPSSLEKEDKILGEVFLCPSRIKKVASRQKKDFNEELAFNFVHGVLHLLGFDHKDTESTKEMRKKEKEILKQANNKQQTTDN